MSLQWAVPDKKLMENYLDLLTVEASPEPEAEEDDCEFCSEPCGRPWCPFTKEKK